MATLAALGVKDDPREQLEREYAAVWSAPTRPVVPREPGAPDWWTGPEEASESFLQAMGVRL